MEPVGIRSEEYPHGVVGVALLGALALYAFIDNLGLHGCGMDSTNNFLRRCVLVELALEGRRHPSRIESDSVVG